MASGLVPVTNAVGAIPEFVNAECGVLAPAEDFAGLATGIESLYLDESRFATMSLNASRRVRRQSDIDDIVAKEMMMFGPAGQFDNEGRVTPRGSITGGNVS